MTATLDMESEIQSYIESVRYGDAYDQALEKENQIWGQVLTNDNRAKRNNNQRSAAVSLNLNRHGIKKSAVLEEYGPYNSCLSIACGTGRAERNLHRLGLIKSADGVDLSSGSIEAAIDASNKEGLNFNYTIGDLNRIEFGEKKYDLIVAQTCLHHIIELEHVLDQIRNALAPNGVFWVSDFVGETRFQWSDRRIQLANTWLEKVPEQFTIDRKSGKPFRVVRRPVDSLASPFEAIRSGEIVDLLLNRFTPVVSASTMSITRMVAPPSVLPNYAKSDQGRELFEELLELDQGYIESGTLGGQQYQALMKISA